VVTIAGIRGLKDDEFNLIKDVIYRESGIRLTEMKKALVQARLMKRLRELKLPDYREYCHFLTNNYDREIINLINCITTNKTDFFREPKHFEFLQEVALPELEHSGRKRITIWSAGCSTGAEPYTIAITLREYFAGRSMPEVKILATDIDTQVLRRGEEGIYSYNEVDTINIELLRRYFKRGTGENEGFFKVKDSVQNMISFRRLNLLDDTYPMKGRFDIIFCRNVIIYFDRTTQEQLLNRFAQRLEPGGYLFLGHSEALTGMRVPLQGVAPMVYRKN